MKAIAITILAALVAVSCATKPEVSGQDIIGSFSVVDGPSISISLDRTGRYEEMNFLGCQPITVEGGEGEGMAFTKVDSGTWQLVAGRLVLKSDRKETKDRYFTVSYESGSIFIAGVGFKALYKKPNQALQHNDPSCHESCLRTPRASRGRG